jgi:hypothetical protein
MLTPAPPFPVVTGRKTLTTLWMCPDCDKRGTVFHVWENNVATPAPTTLRGDNFEAQRLAKLHVYRPTAHYPIRPNKV